MKMKVLGTGISDVNSSKPLLRYCRQRKLSDLPVIWAEAYCKLLLLAWRLRDTAQSGSKPDMDLKPHHSHGYKWLQWREGTFLLIFLILRRSAFDVEKHESFHWEKDTMSGIKMA